MGNEIKDKRWSESQSAIQSHLQSNEEATHRTEIDQFDVQFLKRLRNGICIHAEGQNLIAAHGHGENFHRNEAIGAEGKSRLLAGVDL